MTERSKARRHFERKAVPILARKRPWCVVAMTAAPLLVARVPTMDEATRSRLMAELRNLPQPIVLPEGSRTRVATVAGTGTGNRRRQARARRTGTFQKALDAATLAIARLLSPCAPPLR